MTKRLFDIVVSLVGLVLLSPLMLLAAILVKVSSPGPAFFRQTRVGRAFRPFEIVKFRTMVRTAPAIGLPLTIAVDPRVTRPGWWLRMSKVDELPQLWNVLRGDMSLVGPRPEIEVFVKRFQREYEEVLRVRPGITDLASIRFRNEERVLAASEDPVEAYVTRILPLKIALAREYVQRASFLFDLGILVRTVAQIFMRGGSPDIPAPVPVARDRSLVAVYFGRLAKGALQLALVVVSNYAALALRFGGQPPAWAIDSFWTMLPWLVLLRAVLFSPFRLYQGLWRYTSVFDLLGVIGGIATSSLAFLALTQPSWAQSYIPARLS